MSRSIDRNLNTISNTKRSDIFKKIIQRAPKLSDFVLSKCKGEGKFGKFYPAFHKATGFLFGIKVIKK